MNQALQHLLGRLPRLHVVIVGEAMLDTYLEGTTGRLCPEAPVPVVNVARRLDVPGGAANTAANCQSLDARVSLLSVIGDDAEGRLLCAALESRGIATEHLLREPGRATLAKNRVIAGSQLLVRFDQGTTTPPREEVQNTLIARLASLWPECDAVIVSDYQYGILAPRVIAALADLQARMPHVIVVDSKQLGAYRSVRPTAVKPNFNEALRLLAAGEPESLSTRAEWMAARGDRVLASTGARIAAVTLDAEGALVFEQDRPAYRTYAKPEQHSRASGAGDTFVSALALALAASGDTPAAADLASAAAAVVVAKEGTATCSRRELREHLSEADKYVADTEAFIDRLNLYRREGRRLVFTNGCFDILHRGHVSYLSSAKALGDVLIVGVNSDESIRRLKGHSRPINGLDDRIQVLSALSCVDHVIPFSEDTPHALIRLLRPDVFVKGGDYTRDTLPEAALVEQLGGLVRILPAVSDRSTTHLIERIRSHERLARGGSVWHEPDQPPSLAEWCAATTSQGGPSA